MDGGTVDGRAAIEHLAADLAHPALGAALYQRVSFSGCKAIRRHRGVVPGGRAHGLIRSPDWRSCGSPGPIDAAVRNDSTNARRRPRAPRPPALLAAAVEILLAAGDIDGGTIAVDDLAKVADAVGAPLLHAMAEIRDRGRCCSRKATRIGAGARSDGLAIDGARARGAVRRGAARSVDRACLPCARRPRRGRVELDAAARHLRAARCACPTSTRRGLPPAPPRRSPPVDGSGV